MSDERYVVVTAVSQFRVRYVIPASELETDDPKKLIEYANDSVTVEEVNEFSQTHLGDTIVDTFILDEERMLQLHDRDNGYLADWPKEKKLERIHNWKYDGVNK